MCKNLIPAGHRHNRRCALGDYFTGPATAACQLQPWQEGYCPEPECPWRDQDYVPGPKEYAGIKGSSGERSSPLPEGSVPGPILARAERKRRR